MYTSIAGYKYIIQNSISIWTLESYKTSLLFKILKSQVKNLHVHTYVLYKKDPEFSCHLLLVRLYSI